MKQFSKLFLAGMVALGAVACSVEEAPEELNNNVDTAYAQINIQLPVATRSETVTPGADGSASNDGVEVGQANENEINDVLLVLTKDDAENGYTVVAKGSTTNVAGANGVYVIPLQIKGLTLDGIAKVKVWTICNALTNRVEETVGGIIVGQPIANLNYGRVAALDKNKAFLMTNAMVSESIAVPTDLSAHSSADKPWNLGAVKVERTLCRFDFKVANDGVAKDNKFAMTEPAEGLPQIYVQMNAAHLINLNKSSYLFRRVSAAGNDSDWVLGGAETIAPANYVIDPVWASKQKYVANGSVNLEDLFFDPYCQTDITSQYWYWTELPTAKNPENSNTNNNDKNTALQGDYRRLFYGSENTITPAANQIQALTTGILFRGKIVAEGDGVSAGTSYGVNFNNANIGGKAIYVYQNKLYGTWAKMGDIVKTKPETDAARVIYNYISGLTEDDKNTAGFIGELQQYKDKVAVDNGFTIFRPAADGFYYCYYYYWNRHNDNNKPKEMGVMEFATVRNNVYKLNISKVSKFGHPEKDEDDPDKPDPKDPDEGTEDAYLTVTVKVLPWTVRINDIEF